jgi:hypothetical protein
MRGISWLSEWLLASQEGLLHGSSCPKYTGYIVCNELDDHELYEWWINKDTTGSCCDDSQCSTAALTWKRQRKVSVMISGNLAEIRTLNNPETIPESVTATGTCLLVICVVMYRVHFEVERKSGVMWCGVVWCGVVWCVVWCGVVLCFSSHIKLYRWSQ